MAIPLQPHERLVCIGSTALRAPGGEFLPSVPMYIIVHIDEIDPKTGLVEGEAEVMDDIAKVLAPKFKEYLDGTKENPKKWPGRTKK